MMERDLTSRSVYQLTKFTFFALSPPSKLIRICRIAQAQWSSEVKFAFMIKLTFDNYSSLHPVYYQCSGETMGETCHAVTNSDWLSGNARELY